MVHFLDLPMEIVLLIMRWLSLRDTLELCATNRQTHDTFRSYLLPIIIKFEPGPFRDWAIEKTPYILLCHTLCELYKRQAAEAQMKDLIRLRGASFGYLPNAQLIYDTVNAAGQGVPFCCRPSTQLIRRAAMSGHKYLACYLPQIGRIEAVPNRRIEFLFKNGGSPHTYPGGINRLLMEIVCQKNGLSLEGVCTLLAHGADLRRVLDPHHALMRTFLRQPYIPTHALVLMAVGADIKKSRLDINIIFQRNFLLYGPNPVGHYLATQGADIAKTPMGKDGLLKETFLRHGNCIASAFLLHMGASIDLDWLHTELAEEFLRHGASPRFHRLLSYPHADLQDVPGGIDSLLEFEIRHCGLCHNVRLLLDYGAGASNSPAIEELLMPLFWDAILTPVDIFTVFGYLNIVKGWEFGEDVLSRCIGDILCEHGHTSRMEAVLQRVQIPITKGSKYRSPFETQFMNGPKSRGSGELAGALDCEVVEKQASGLSRYGRVFSPFWHRPAYHTSRHSVSYR